MKDIQIKRFTDHPQGALGLIQYGGDGGEWYALIDALGLPHVSVRMRVKDADGNESFVYSDPEANTDYELTAAGMFDGVFDLADPEGDCSEADADECAATMTRQYEAARACGHWVENGNPVEHGTPHVCVPV